MRFLPGVNARGSSQDQAESRGDRRQCPGTGLPAIEQLRQVFNELHAHTVRDYVAFPSYYRLFSPDGTLRDPQGPEDAARAMLDQLLWWGSVLHDARRDRPQIANR